MELKNIESKKEVSVGALRDRFIEKLKDLYNAEYQLVKALPKMEMAASSSELRSAFSEHIEITQEHANRLDKILTDLNENPRGVNCKAMEGFVEEGREAIEMKQEDSNIKDAGLIAAAQRVEHYVIAGYGTVHVYAQKLGLNDAAKLLHQTLQEEGEADKALTLISNELLLNIEK